MPALTSPTLSHTSFTNSHPTWTEQNRNGGVTATGVQIAVQVSWLWSHNASRSASFRLGESWWNLVHLSLLVDLWLRLIDKTLFPSRQSSEMRPKIDLTQTLKVKKPTFFYLLLGVVFFLYFSSLHCDEWARYTGPKGKKSEHGEWSAGIWTNHQCIGKNCTGVDGCQCVDWLSDNEQSKTQCVILVKKMADACTVGSRFEEVFPKNV